MIRRNILVLAAVALAVVAATPSAKAVCGAPQWFVTSFSDSGAGDFFFGFGPNDATDSATVIGRWWDANSRANSNEGGTAPGTCADEVWLFDLEPGVTKYAYGQSGSTVIADACDNAGACVAVNSSMIMLVQTTTTDGRKGRFAAARVKNGVDLGLGTTFEFDFSRIGRNLDLIDMPRPRVLSSSRSGAVPGVSGGTVTANLRLSPIGFNQPHPGYYTVTSDAVSETQTVVQYQLLEALSATDPGRNPAQWTTTRATRTYTGADDDGLVAQTFDCSNLALDRWIAIRMVFEGGTTDFPADYVGEAVRIECDPNLAEPGSGFKIIDREKKGPKSPTRN